MYKSHFEDITVADVLALLKAERPELELDISCFINELIKEKELLESTLEDVLSLYEGDLYREAYYDGDKPAIEGTFYFKELRDTMRERFPGEEWLMSGDYQVEIYPSKPIDRWETGILQRRIAQFTILSDKSMIEIEYKIFMNHKTDGIEITTIRRK